MVKILIVDDEEDLTWSLSRGLSKKFPDWQILVANSFHEAQNLLRANVIDCLITDLRMPDGDGIELILKAKRNNSKMLSVLMTAYGSVDLTQTLIHHSEIIYLEKPFEIERLREIISKWIAQPAISRDISKESSEQRCSIIVSGVVFS